MLTRNFQVPFPGGKLGGGLIPKSGLTLETPWTVACQDPMSIGFSRQEYWSGLPFPSPGDVPDPETEPTSCISCVGRQIPYHWATGKPNFPLNDNLNPGAAQTTY